MSELNLIEQRLECVERKLAELKSRTIKQRSGNPWVRMQGVFANEPLFDEWQFAIEQHRRLRDGENQLS